MGWIVNLSTGQPTSITAQSMLYALGTPDIVGPFPTRKGEVKFVGDTGYYLPKDAYIPVDDPQCGQVTTLQNLRGQCTIDAIADASKPGRASTSKAGNSRNAGAGCDGRPGPMTL